MYIVRLVSRSVGLPLLHNHSLQVFALCHLAFDVLDNLGEVGGVLISQFLHSLAITAEPTSSSFVHSSLGNSWWVTEHCSVLAGFDHPPVSIELYLESTSQTVHTVVGILRRQALEGELDYVVLLRNEIIGSAESRMSACYVQSR